MSLGTTSRRPTDGWGPGAVAPTTSAPLPVAGGPPAVESGAVLVLRQFDIADEIDLGRVAALVPAEKKSVTARGTPLLLPSPPLALPLGARTIRLADREFQAELTARLFDFGAVSIRLRIALPSPISWAETSALVRAAQVDEQLTRLAREEADRLADRLAPALSQRHHSALFEDYVILAIDRLSVSTYVGEDGVPLPLPDLARLMLGEPPGARLSANEVAEATRHRASYSGEDLCVAGWSTAVVVEPAGDTDVIDVIELANAQLLELRYYDELLDRELDHLYGEVALRRRRARGPFRSYAKVLHRTMAVMLEIAEFVERVENAIKIIGDTYLARLYGAVVDSLRIPAWEAGVTRKQALLQQVYNVLRSEVDATRALLVEVLVVLLIVAEVMLALRSH